MTPAKQSLAEFRRRLVAGSFPRYPNLAAALENLGFVQADPIRSPARAQDLILRQRVAAYRAGDLERQFPELGAEEGYLFAYGFMRPDVWHDLRRHRRSTLTPLEHQILTAVKERGEVGPRDLDERFSSQSVQNCWGGKSKTIRQVLDELRHAPGIVSVKTLSA